MTGNLSLYDYKPEASNLYQAVIDGFSRKEKSIPAKFFYDRRGSELFEQICEQPEYYPPRVERGMLARLAGEIASLTGRGRILIEPGAGNTGKVRLLLEALRPAAFVPMDISFEHLKQAAEGLATDFPWLAILAACVDYTHSLPIPDATPAGPRLLFFPGSSVGNFHRQEVLGFLGRVRQALGADGMLLIGVDTKKDPVLLNAAYNDAQGVTARFNLNLLQRMRRELAMECRPEQFEHRAFYNESLGRIEMHLVSRQRQRLSFDGHSFELGAGETLHTENSYKYAPQEFIALAEAGGFRHRRHWLDEQGLFAIYLFEVWMASGAPGAGPPGVQCLTAVPNGACRPARR